MNYKHYNDYELIYMVRENEEDCKSLLLMKYNPIIHRIANDFYLKYSTYGYDYEDFYQEAVIAFYHALSVYDEKKDSLFYSFCILCIKRSLMSFCRNISRCQKSISNQFVSDIDRCSVVDLESDIQMNLNKTEIQKIMRRVLSDFPIEESSILELKLNGFTYREIGTLLDIPASSVEFRSRKARTTLMSKVHNYYCK